MLPNSLYLRHMTNILITTTPTVENRPVREYLGIVSGEAFMREWWLDHDILRHGTEALDNFDFDKSHSDLIGLPYIPSSILTHRAFVHSAARKWADFKAELHKARDWAIQQMAKAAEELGANAVIGVKIEYKTISEPDKNVRAMMLIATGTAVRL
jgi:uncharacterized protein YbjQ (UPF0145 family)